MRLQTLLQTGVLAALSAYQLPGATANLLGLNVADKRPDGSCKNRADWVKTFSDLRSLPTPPGSSGFRSARTFAASDCGTLELAVPTAVEAGVSLVVGLWSGDDGHWGRETAALRAALSANRSSASSWLKAIMVGNEDIYRGNSSPAQLRERIGIIRNLLNEFSLGGSVPIGHADVWASWEKDETAQSGLIKACDIIGHQSYPYWEGAAGGASGGGADAREAFWNRYSHTRAAVENPSTGKPGTPIWVTETGWPVKGDTVGSAVASVANARAFWKDIGCSLAASHNLFWYVHQDYNNSPSFGIFNSDQKLVYDMGC